MKDNLKYLLSLQYGLDSVNVDYSSLNFTELNNETIMTVKNRLLDIIDQCTKLLNNFPYKSTLNNKDYNYGNVLWQYNDIFTYVLGFYNFLLKDTEYNDMLLLFSQRLELEHFKNKWMHNLYNGLYKNDKIIMIDIDGVIADWNSSYEKFLVSKGEVVYDNSGQSYSPAIRYNIPKYKDEKYQAEFILHNKYLSISVFPKMLKFIKVLNRNNIKIIFVTARPYNEYKILSLHTFMWLKKYDIKFEYIIFNKDKADAVVSISKYITPLCFIEDRDKHAIELSHINIKTFLIDKEYNQNINNVKNIIRIKNDDYSEIYKLLNIKE